MKTEDININEFLQSPVLLQLGTLTEIASADVPMDDAKVYGSLQARRL